MNPYRITVKIGSNVLTRKDGTLDVTRMSAIVDQVSELYKQGIQLILVSSGAVASGRSELKGKVNTDRLETVDQRQLFSAVGQAKLINKYYELFRDHGISCGQVLTTKESFGSRQHYLNQKNCMEVMLSQGIVPIVNENDTISVTELMFTDNDELSGLIATMMDARMLIILSNIDGVYTGDPKDPDSKLIPVIESDANISQYIQVAKSSFGRGGMITKQRIARKVAAEGIEVIISNGKHDNVLLQLVNVDPTTGLNHIAPDTLCTRFRPEAHKTSSVKKWIAHSEDFSKGALYINDGAANALYSNQAASLLPVGVSRIEGAFDEGDLVLVKAETSGQTLGVGQISCGYEEAQKIIGQKDQKPFIHYDYLWLE